MLISSVNNAGARVYARRSKRQVSFLACFRVPFQLEHIFIELIWKMNAKCKEMCSFSFELLSTVSPVQGQKSGQRERYAEL